ncbi:DUF642 domain-containing protein [Rathayibacter festucae]|uniref:DUF642 domain-containing protein n=1 Tax=Rathayibacter festucae TaxID=110937 RepID=UPI002A6A3C3E|nr:DUF642 domain-containing protein [Rathayibacter festucae]MDY0914533.1 DUF642 domain-containing protein [Rathayibacter festucae]
MAAILTVSAGALSAPAAHAAGTTYYVDSGSSSCSDSSSGTSSSAAWCSLTAASRQYSPGDQLLIARGSTYSGQTLVVSGQGTEQARIIVGAYGTGARPALFGAAAPAFAGKALVLLQNPSFVTVSSLALDGAGAGVLAQYRSNFPGSVTGNQSLEFSDLVVTRISGIGSARVFTSLTTPGPQNFDCSSNSLDLWQSGGVAVTGEYGAPVPSTSYFVNGVTFRNIEGHNNLNVVNVDTCDGRVGNPSAPNGPAPHLVRNVVVDNVYAYDGDGAGYSQLCNEGMRFDGVTGLRVINSRMERLGACTVAGGTAAVILVAVTDALFANNIISDVPVTGSADQTAIDHEIYVDKVQLRNNLLARNGGPAVEYLSLRGGIPDYNTNHVVSGNSFANNGASLGRLNCCGVPFSAAITDNLYADDVFLSDIPASSLGTGNVMSRKGTAPTYSADVFSPVSGLGGWSYETTTNVSANSWTAASFTDGARIYGVWGGGGAAGSIAAFEQTAGTCSTCATARVWTAPTNGTVAIRSLALKSLAGGASTSVRVTKNTGVVAGPLPVSASNTTGASLNATVAVAKGDKLRFELSGASAPTDWTSWAPAVTYIENTSTNNNAVFENAGFEAPAVGPGQVSYAPSEAWTFSPTNPGVQGAGIVGNGSEFGNSNAPEGAQAAFLQSRGSATQTIAGLVAGARYQVRFDIARRGAETQAVQVVTNGAIAGSASPTSSIYATVTGGTFTAIDGPNTISLQGTATTDQTAFVDRVTLVPLDLVPNRSSFEGLVGAGAFAYQPSGSTWSFTSSAGVAQAGSAFDPPPVVNGTATAFLQGQATISQPVPGFASGMAYSVVFSAVQRDKIRKSEQVVEVLVDGVVRATITPDRSWRSYATPAFQVTTGTHDVALRSTVPGDVTAFVDNVSIVRASATSITNGGFESPALSTGAIQYGGMVDSWLSQPQTRLGGSGIARNGSGFGATAAEGAQVAFVQRGASLRSTSALQPGVYTVTFGSIQRTGQAVAQQLRVQLDGSPALVFTPTSAWRDNTVLVSVPPGGEGRLEFVGNVAGTDSTAFVDNIRVSRLG